MCRWLAYSGNPVFLDELILKPEHSLIDQSFSARSAATPTNGDGFGIGWYAARETPGLYRSIRPAWNDRNLRNLAEEIQSGLFIAHIRAATGTAVQQTNCHPFRFGKWLFVHNGVIRGFRKMKRDLVNQVSPELYPYLEGTTDSEVMFFLALTLGLEEDIIGASERMAYLVESVGRAHGEEAPLTMTLGISDGHRLFAIRYASDGNPRSLFHSREMRALKELNPQVDRFSDDARAVVSEPFGRLSEAWTEIQPSTAVVVDGERLEIRDFGPRGD
ncbi:MAG: class II glutamine amidotransferase [Thermoanaerobaculales bacterium]